MFVCITNNRLLVAPLFASLIAADEVDGMDAILQPMIDSAMNVGLAHLVRKMTGNLTDTDGLQAPFSLAISKAAVSSYKKMQAGDDDAVNPLMNMLASVVFADTLVQNVTELPSPWALEVSNGLQKSMNMVDKQDNGMNSFALASISSLLAMPNSMFDEPKERKMKEEWEEERGE